MIYRYDDKFIDFDDVSFMELVQFTFDNDPALKLKIHTKNGKVHEIQEMVNYKRSMNGGHYKSEYPLEKLRKVPNAWMRYRNNRNMIVERTITKTGNTEIIIEKLLYNQKAVDQTQSKTE